MRYYRNTFILLGLVLSGSLATYFSLVGWCAQLRIQRALESSRAGQAQRSVLKVQKEEIDREAQVRPLREFSKAWQQHIQNGGPKELGNVLRNGLTTLATRAALTSEGATVSGEPRLYSVAGHTIPVEQVKLTVVGDSLPAVVAWLGSVEQAYAYGRVEALNLSAYGSRSLQLNVTLLYPIEESASHVPSNSNYASVVKP